VLVNRTKVLAQVLKKQSTTIAIMIVAPGDPLDRDPKLVLGDVLDGYVSIEGAREDYGVVVRLEELYY
jgi:N-methylhydantoinase B/oxoprolinase/acetone carboxylase alpha subunit